MDAVKREDPRTLEFFNVSRERCTNSVKSLHWSYHSGAMGAVVNMGLLETPNLLCEGAASAKNDTIALKPNRAVVLTSFRAGMRIVIRTDKEQNAYGATQEDSLSRATPGLAF